MIELKSNPRAVSWANIWALETTQDFSPDIPPPDIILFVPAQAQGWPISQVM